MSKETLTGEAEDLDLKTKSQGDDDLVIVEEPIVKIQSEDDKKIKSEENDEVSVESTDEFKSANSDEEREAIRERRRAEKIERKERREHAIKRDKVERDFLLKRNDELERRLSSVENTTFKNQIAEVDRQIKSATDEVRMADEVIAKAVAAGNGDDVVKAMGYRDEARLRAQQLIAIKQNSSNQTPATNPGIDERVMTHAKDFLKENPWYDTQGRDENSAIVLAIDSALVRDGYDPTSGEYWDELRKRASRRLPEKFKATEPEPTQEDRKPRGGPALGSGREHAPSSTRREIYISPERKEALVSAGVWDDPVLRMKYVKRYAEYDKQNRA